MERLNCDVRPIQSAFQAAPKVFEGLSVNLAVYISLKMINDLVCVFIFNGQICGMFVGVKLRSFFDGFLNGRTQRVFTTIWDYLGLHFTPAMEHSHHDSF